MTGKVRIHVNGTALIVAADLTLAAALLNAGHSCFRRSVTGEPRGPICGMGTCFECRVTVDGLPGRRACLEPVRDNMQVTVDE